MVIHMVGRIPGGGMRKLQNPAPQLAICPAQLLAIRVHKLWDTVHGCWRSTWALPKEHAFSTGPCVPQTIPNRVKRLYTLNYNCNPSLRAA